MSADDIEYVFTDRALSALSQNGMGVPPKIAGADAGDERVLFASVAARLSSIG